jgi:hypothetical protein
VPIVAYFRNAPEGEGALAHHPTLARWWAQLAKRAIVQAILD